jgi:branched-chain amino acid transport system ATP-binding protein
MRSDQEEPYESRDSRTDLREPGGETPLGDSTGLLWPDEGEILFDGRRVDSMPAHAIAARGLVHVPEGRKIFPRLTVRENLEMGAFARGPVKNLEKEFRSVCDLFPVLGDRWSQPGGTLSGGEQQMLAIGRALMARPKLLMLDEPSMGLAPLMVRKIFSVLRDIHRRGTPVLLVEQNAQEALAIAQRGYVIETGRLVREGKAKDLADDPAVRSAYLGIS